MKEDYIDHFCFLKKKITTQSGQFYHFDEGTCIYVKDICKIFEFQDTRTVYAVIDFRVHNFNLLEDKLHEYFEIID